MQRWDEKHEMLVRVAREAFSKYGFKKTTLEDIAEMAGVGKSTVYYYFESKEMVFSEVTAQEAGLVMEALKKSIQNAAEPKDQLVAFLKTRYEYVTNLPNLYSVSQEILREIFPLTQAERDKFRKKELAMLVAILKEGIRRGDFRKCDTELLALTIIASLNGLTELFMMYGKDDRIAKGMDGLLDLFLNGLKNQ